MMSVSGSRAGKGLVAADLRMAVGGRFGFHAQVDWVRFVWVVSASRRWGWFRGLGLAACAGGRAYLMSDSGCHLAWQGVRGGGGESVDVFGRERYGAGEDLQLSAWWGSA